MIDKLTAEKIKNTADIVEVVSDYVHLTRRGANYMGLCPFHNERTPSFSVNRRRNFCYCFSCHKGGSPVNFIMEKEGVSYHDALLQLAAKYGIQVEERELSDEERAAITRRESMLVTNDWAMRHMQEVMRATDEGRDVGLQYFYQRGITEEAIKEFRLGYVLDSGNELTASARKSGIDVDVLKQVGLTGTSQNGREYDRFHGRVMFPILNSSGKAIAFGGRDLKGGPAKYINSPESEIYVKSNELYGIYQAKSEIVKRDRCFLVEGYMDVIGMWQSGMKNVVASSGTALTDGQIALIHRFTNNVTLIYDGDAAGIKASLRGVNMLLSHKMQVKVLLLPEGKDPDEFAREHTPEEFQEYVEKHQTDVIRFKAQVLLQDVKDDPQRKTQAIMSVVESIACIPMEVERNIYIQECSRLFGVDDASVSVTVANARAQFLTRLEKERRLREFDRTRSENGGGQPPAPADSASPDIAIQTATPVATPRFNLNMGNPLEPFERKIIENCIRYGFVGCIDETDDEGNRIVMNVAEYIADELAADEIKLSTPLYDYILSQFNVMKEDYLRAEQACLSELQEEQNRKREEVFHQIGVKGLSMGEIQREEKKLEESLERERSFTLDRFRRDYAGNVLASHENADVRKLVNEIINDRYRLSNIFTRQRSSDEFEDEVTVIVDRSLTELRSEIVNLEIKKVKKSIADAENDQNDDLQVELLQKLTMLMKIRSALARNIGERIISPR